MSTTDEAARRLRDALEAEIDTWKQVPLSAMKRLAWKALQAALAQQAPTPAASEPAAPVDARDAEAENGEVLAWFVDANEGGEKWKRPIWVEVHDGDPMWSDNWKRYPLRDAIARQAAAPAEGEKS